jgi:Alpha/beta hydrolase domain
MHATRLRLSLIATGWLVFFTSQPIGSLLELPGGAVAKAGAAAKVEPVAATSPPGDAAHGYPFNATPMDLARQGYLEEEFFVSGVASRYNTPPMATGTVIDGGHPYKTRVVVRRPKSQSRFNGTTIVEWTNVSQGHDNEVDWFQSGAHLVHSGFAWIGVSAQRVGVDALKQWSPGRYGTLNVSDGGTITDDALSYDIFTAAALAISHRSIRSLSHSTAPHSTAQRPTTRRSTARRSTA